MAAPIRASLDTILAGLEASGEVTRLRLLALLADAELTVSELVTILGQRIARPAALGVRCNDRHLGHRGQCGVQGHQAGRKVAVIVAEKNVHARRCVSERTPAALRATALAVPGDPFGVVCE